MTEERLAALEALYRRTTPEVWAYDLGDYVVARPDTALHDWIPIADLYEGGPHHVDPIATGEWIADMHGAFDELLGDWRRWRAALEDITDTPELTSDRAIGIAKRALGEEVAE